MQPPALALLIPSENMVLALFLSLPPPLCLHVLDLIVGLDL